MYPVRSAIKISDLTPHLIYQFKSEHELVETIHQISEAFTTHRENLSRYLNDPKYVSAYTLFYLTTNIPKLQAVIDLLPKTVTSDWNQMYLIDVGAGPGTFSFAWANLFKTTAITQWENSPLMQEQSFKIMKAIFPELKIHLNQVINHTQKILLFGHSLNEMGVTVGINFEEKEKPEQILLIEPGTKSMFVDALLFREEMIKRGYKIVYPCFSQALCPMKGSDDWCHQYLDVKHDSSVERLTQLAKMDRRHLPGMIHLYLRSEVKESLFQATIVRVLPETKFSYEWQVCFMESGQNIIEQWQVMKKDYSKAENKRIFEYHPGKQIEVLEKLIKGHVKRVKLKLSA